MAEEKTSQPATYVVETEFRAGFYGGRRLTASNDPTELFGPARHPTRRDRPVRVRPARPSHPLPVSRKRAK